MQVNLLNSMTQENSLIVLIVTGAWVVLELLKYVFSRTLEAATKNKRKAGNPGNSVMTAGELRGHIGEIKELLGETRDAAIGAKAYAKQTLDEVKK